MIREACMARGTCCLQTAYINLELKSCHSTQVDRDRLHGSSRSHHGSTKSREAGQWNVHARSAQLLRAVKVLLAIDAPPRAVRAKFLELGGRRPKTEIS